MAPPPLDNPLTCPPPGFSVCPPPASPCSHNYSPAQQLTLPPPPLDHPLTCPPPGFSVCPPPASPCSHNYSPAQWLTLPPPPLDHPLICPPHSLDALLHNGWLDLLFLYHSFYGALPPSSTSLMADQVEMFSIGVYDTKGIAQFKIMEDATYLEYVFNMVK